MVEVYDSMRRNIYSFQPLPSNMLITLVTILQKHDFVFQHTKKACRRLASRAHDSMVQVKEAMLMNKLRPEVAVYSFRC